MLAGDCIVCTVHVFMRMRASDREGLHCAQFPDGSFCDNAEGIAHTCLIPCN